MGLGGDELVPGGAAVGFGAGRRSSTRLDWLTSDWTSMGKAAAKTALLFALATVGSRVNPRRALSEYSPFDFAALLGVGATIGRTATAKDTSFAAGAGALVALLAMHHIVSRLRFARRFSGLINRPVRVLIRDAQQQRHYLRRAASRCAAWS